MTWLTQQVFMSSVVTVLHDGKTGSPTMMVKQQSPRQQTLSDWRGRPSSLQVVTRRVTCGGETPEMLREHQKCPRANWLSLLLRDERRLHPRGQASASQRPATKSNTYRRSPISKFSPLRLIQRLSFSISGQGPIHSVGRYLVSTGVLNTLELTVQ